MSGTTSQQVVGGIRTFGRVTDSATGARWWVVVNPDAQGYQDQVYLTALVQCCKLNWGESPFFANWGIPAHPSVLRQVPPDYYMALLQQRFAPYFLALVISRVPSNAQTYQDALTPTYQIDVQLHSGAQISMTIPNALVDGFSQPVVDGHGYPIAAGGQKTGKYVAL